MSKKLKTQITLVKRYTSGRLYDTTRLCYVSIEQLRQWANAGVAFSVVDAATGGDVKAMLLA